MFAKNVPVLVNVYEVDIAELVRYHVYCVSGANFSPLVVICTK